MEITEEAIVDVGTILIGNNWAKTLIDAGWRKIRINADSDKLRIRMIIDLENNQESTAKVTIIRS